MSDETASWLNTMTLIGFTEQRGHAWHYRAAEQVEEPNHYPGAVPVADVRRRLFDWRVTEGDVTASAVVMDADGVATSEVRDSTRKAMLRPPGAFGPDDQGAILGVFKSGYQGHDYEERLLGQVAAILDDDLAIGSAGLLKGGAVAWVSVEVPDSITTPEGVQFRPHLLATTSFDGSLGRCHDSDPEDHGYQRSHDHQQEVAPGSGHDATPGRQQVDAAGVQRAEQRGAVRRARIGEQMTQVAAADPDRYRHRKRFPHRAYGGREDERGRSAAQQPVRGAAVSADVRENRHR